MTKRARSRTARPSRTASMSNPAAPPEIPAISVPIEVLGALGRGLAREEPVEVGPVPVRVGDLVVGARRDEQLVAPVRERRGRALPASCA